MKTEHSLVAAMFVVLSTRLKEALGEERHQDHSAFARPVSRRTTPPFCSGVQFRTGCIGQSLVLQNGRTDTFAVQDFKL